MQMEFAQTKKTQKWTRFILFILFWYTCARNTVVFTYFFGTVNMGHGNIYTHILRKKHVFLKRFRSRYVLPNASWDHDFSCFFERLIDVVRPVFLRVRKARSLWVAAKFIGAEDLESNEEPRVVVSRSRHRDPMMMLKWPIGVKLLQFWKDFWWEVQILAVFLGKKHDAFRKLDLFFFFFTDERRFFLVEWRWV